MQLDPPPEYFQTRIEIFDKLKQEYDAAIEGKLKLVWLKLRCSCLV